VGRPTQGSGANAATLGFTPLPRWGIGDRAYDGPRAGPLTRGRTGAAVGASGLCAPPAVRGLLSGALKGRCPPAQGNALGTRVPLPHSTLKGCSNRTSHTALCRTPSGCWIGGRRFSQGVALGWYVLPFQGRRTTRRVRASTDACPFTRGRVWPAVGPWPGGLLVVVVVVSGPAAAG
jgi:hypothetical protein